MVGAILYRMDVSRHRTRAIIYLASACAAASAALSAYWALGGSAGARGVGEVAQTVAAGPRQAVLWAVVIVKLAGALLPLSLMFRWGGAIPARLRMSVTAAAGTALTLYGALLTGAAALVETGAIHPSGGVDWTAMRWHLGLWDPWFLVWGILLVMSWQLARATAAR
jgi:hypothetical protein